MPPGFGRAKFLCPSRLPRAEILSDLRQHQQDETPGERRKRKLDAARRKTRRTHPA
ncbi:MAG: 30S ribosomal protein S21 [Gemmatimonadetes bacterium]|nr:MAG: 30S ribosomal protein S21 [Gemmatimonadota bacterium]